eukprot:TRINITY_DN2314_c0_g1_i1.p1 TRINITY_DN2314_c0_g1~~TRINITY_DN2314_c0_g1_i1.p1  ORF type:complete len:131 (-),score=33.30 TRINITY_DN2314_c0_g1_i1:67-459(-)
MVEENLKQQKEWSRAVIFDHEGNALASTFKPNNPELKALTTAFADYDKTMGYGIVIEETPFLVHRIYDDLIYGRNEEESETGEGFCLYRMTSTKTQQPIFALITYGFPILSARAIPTLKQFCRDNNVTSL